MLRKKSVVLSAALISTIALSSCSSKASESGSTTSSGDLKVDFGVDDETITLGVQTDQTGPFKVIGLTTTYGSQIWADEVNAAGGICDREIVFDIGDHGYKADNAVALYESQKQDVLGLVQLLGSPILAAVKQRITDDQVLSIPASWASDNLDSPSVLMIGATYDIEAINGLAFLQEQGFISDGDTIGQIYLDSEAGQNTLAGTMFYAKEHNLTVVEAPISATDTDLTTTITKMKDAGVKAISIMSSPASLGSAAIQVQAQGLDVPIVGSNPTYAPSLLSDPGTVEALSNYYLVQSVAPYDFDNEMAEKIRAAYEETGATDEPTQQVLAGYINGLAWQAILETACEAGDMTRAGILAAREQVDDVDAFGIMGNLDFSKPGAPTTRETFIEQVDPNAPGGLTIVSELAVSDEAAQYKAPHED